MDKLYNALSKTWEYEYKYRRGGKTLYGLYAKKDCMGFMIIFGKRERETFESDRANYSDEIQSVYDGSKNYHDGKWMMFNLNDTSLFPEIEQLLKIKRKPNKK